MRNKLVIVCSIFIGMSSAPGQVLVQDASNTSSLVYQGTTINVDAAQTRASFSINQFTNESTNSANPHLYWGIQASADSKNGLAGFLKTGSIFPNANFRFTIGGTWTEGSATLKGLNEALNRAQAVNNQLNLDMQSSVNSLVAEAHGKLSTAALKTGLVNANRTNAISTLSSAISALVAPANNDIDNLILTTLSKKVESIYEEYATNDKQASDKVSEIRQEILRRFWLKRYVVYGIVEGSASKFILLTNSTQANYSKRFVDTTFQSPRIGIGFNKQIGGKSIWGFSITQEKADNFFSLTDKEFTIITTDQVTNTTETTDPKSATVAISNLTGKKTFTGYEGTYKTYWRSAVHIDYAHFFPGKEADRTTILWHAYFRQSFSWFKEAAPNITKIGTGLYTFRDNGTFTGGLYIEVDDVFNNLEKQKVTPVLTPFYRRLSLGIVTKLALNSIISYR